MARKIIDHLFNTENTFDKEPISPKKNRENVSASTATASAKASAKTSAPLNSKSHKQKKEPAVYVPLKSWQALVARLNQVQAQVMECTKKIELMRSHEILRTELEKGLTPSSSYENLNPRGFEPHFNKQSRYSNREQGAFHHPHSVPHNTPPMTGGVLDEPQQPIARPPQYPPYPAYPYPPQPPPPFKPGYLASQTSKNYNKKFFSIKKALSKNEQEVWRVLEQIKALRTDMEGLNMIDEYDINEANI